MKSGFKRGLKREKDWKKTQGVGIGVGVLGRKAAMKSWMKGGFEKGDDRMRQCE